jgi:ATP-dependent Lon protease
LKRENGDCQEVPDWKQRKRWSEAERFQIEDKAILRIIEGYTRESRNKKLVLCS